ncbi:MAG: radical SAM protein, partial [Deltaproteobacteria bacterium]|nr:radical SAM protein [Deltaproteobacteria bacterium]
MKVEKDIYASTKDTRLGIEVTTQCNSDCHHCFARAGISAPSSLSLKLVKEIMAEGYTVGYRHLHLTGGEPLLWKGLFAALDYGFRRGYETVFLNTNGTLLADGSSRRLAAYDSLTLSVSLEGSEAFHNHLRGEGSYRRAVKGIEKALDAGIDLVIFTILCKSLLPSLPHFIEDLYNRFPRMAYLTLIQPIWRTDHSLTLSGEILDPEDFLQLVKAVSLLNLYGVRTHVQNDPLVNVVSKMIEMPWVPPVQPFYRVGNLIIKANRTIALSHASEESFGEYKPGRIEKVLNSEDYQKAVAPDESHCPRCKYTELCSEHGMLRPSERYEDLYS